MLKKEQEKAANEIVVKQIDAPKVISEEVNNNIVKQEDVEEKVESVEVKEEKAINKKKDDIII